MKSLWRGEPILRRFTKTLWLVFAGFCVAAGTVGIFLPGLPTTPFLILAAWAAPKGSEKLARWIHTHPTFGPTLHAWHTQGAIPARAKAAAVLLMTCSWATLWWVAVPSWLLWLVFILFVCLSAFLLSRPPPIKNESSE